MIISIGRKLTCNLVLILTPDQPFDDYSQWEYGLTLTGDGRRSTMTWLKQTLIAILHVRIQRGVGVRIPPRNHKLYGFL